MRGRDVCPLRNSSTVTDTDVKRRIGVTSFEFELEFDQELEPP